MREQPKPDPTRCPICNYAWDRHTTKGARKCRADLARRRGEEPVVAVPRPPTAEERAEMDRRAAKRAGDLELVGASNGHGTRPVHVAQRLAPVARIAGARAHGVDPKAARAWAIATGLTVPVRGMLPRSIIDAYRAAQDDGATLVEPCDISPKVLPAEVTSPPVEPSPPPAVDLEQLVRRALADALRAAADRLDQETADA